jgi:2-hydroxy-3-keto-5-methylthiopentenyl-1-phosphate phosphatase
MLKTLIQCDFDNTITDIDISFLLLDVFGDSSWRELFRQYQQGKLTLAKFNGDAFGMVKASRQVMLDYIKDKFSVRPGFSDMVRLCQQKGHRFVVVSNGLDFYIEEILKNVGLSGIEFHAAKTEFHPQRLKVQYIGPDGKVLEREFKNSYVNMFLNEGYRIIYAGDGSSDFIPAKRCYRVFARENLLSRCRQDGVDCIPFTDFTDIIKTIDSW